MGFVAREVCFGLLQRRLVWARIELRDQIALVNRLTFNEGDLLDRAGDLRVDIHHVVRLHRPDASQHDRNIADLDLGRVDRNRCGDLGWLRCGL